jgi:hypothetical protein
MVPVSQGRHKRARVRAGSANLGCTHAEEGTRFMAARSEITVVADGGDNVAADLRPLLARLRSDDDLPGLVATLEHGPVDPRSLGTVDEVLRLVFDSKLVVGVAGALTTWLTTRRRGVKLTVKRRGQELELDAPSPKDAEDVLKQLKDFLDED